MAIRRPATTVEIPLGLGAARAQALAAAGIARAKVCVTNAVKHFKNEPRGVHPSYLLRGPPENRDAETAQFVADLKAAVRYARAQGIDL